ncbi:transposable element tc1 transposase [Hirsutella rhossiliensis]|uniref:Transposable element tc1 transposase n=1 Tax=Hirsutella rhossiliensis TaxID=111463 RepID=A0A9P8SG57_9HYPO|nr:transposable element tc1 transposase [Hirsutella rhossiliensis]KAH0960095.1 transposable element tc1 transposase [Hirsutella rhossiliensis]
MPTVQLRKNATIATVRFGGNEPTNTIGITTVITPIGEVVFHVINMSTPFLLCLKDMDRLGAYLNNVTNELICGDKRIPIIKADAPRRFKFTLKDNCDFNYELIVDVMHLDSRDVEALKLCWIDTYLGPPDVITHDAGTNFASSEFQAEAKLLGITCHQVPVEAHWSIASAESLLQMAFKSVNDTAGPDGLVPTLLVFEVTVELDNGPAKFRSTALRAEKKITTAGRPFEASDDLEITNLLGAGVIVPERYDMNKHGKHRLFKSRMVREVKGYGDDEKQINVTTAETNADTALQVNAFGVAALQTDDTLLVGTTTFLQREDRELCFQAKPKKTLREVMQKGQVNNLKIIDLSTEDRAQRYVEQRAHPTAEDFQALNKRIQWQIDNPQRGLRFVPIGLEAAKVFVFTDGSFANNKDLSSQIGFVIIIATETNSTKYSYSLYECLVKLGTTTEKRLMIDIMALRQAYEQREITNIRWINGADNPADAMTKLSPNGALTRFVNDNEITIRLEGWVQRKEDMTA